MMNWEFSDNPRFERLVLESNVELNIFEGGHSPDEILLTEKEKSLDVILRDSFRIVDGQNHVSLGRLRITIERA